MDQWNEVALCSTSSRIPTLKENFVTSHVKYIIVKYFKKVFVNFPCIYYWMLKSKLLEIINHFKWLTVGIVYQELNMCNCLMDLIAHKEVVRKNSSMAQHRHKQLVPQYSSLDPIANPGPKIYQFIFQHMWRMDN